MDLWALERLQACSCTHPPPTPSPPCLQITELRERAAELPDELFVCLVSALVDRF